MINRLDSINSKDVIVMIVMILQILFFIICISIISTQMSVHTSSTKEHKTERYRSIRICPGETLWEISRRYYSEEYENVHAYMEKIMRLNNMSDEDINSGAYLVIPYYD